MKKLYYLILPVITLLFGFIFTSNTYAIDDVVLTLDASNSSLIGICNNTNPSSSLSGHACTDFNYLILTSSTSFSSHSPYFMIGDNKIFADSIEAIISLDSSTNYSVFTYNSSSLPSGWSVSVTLSESYGGSCPEPDPCPEPEPCDCDDAFIVGLFKDSFWRVATAIVALIVPILALFLLFRLVHGLMFGKGI